MPGIAALSPQSDSAKTMQIMSSSKSIGVIQNTSTGGNSSQSDSAKRHYESLTRKIKDSLDNYNKLMLLDGSKSSTMFSPVKTFGNIKMHTILTTRSEKQYSNEKRDSINRSNEILRQWEDSMKQREDSMKSKKFQIMYSSKSGQTVSIQDIKLIKGTIDSMMKTDSSKIKSKKTPATKTPKK